MAKKEHGAKGDLRLCARAHVCVCDLVPCHVRASSGWAPVVGRVSLHYATGYARVAIWTCGRNKTARKRQEPAPAGEKGRPP